MNFVILVPHHASPPPSPSPSTSRAKPSPDRGSAKKKSPLEKNLLNESSLDNPDLGPFLLKLARDTIASSEGPSKVLDYAMRTSKSLEIFKFLAKDKLDRSFKKRRKGSFPVTNIQLRLSDQDLFQCIFWIFKFLKCTNLS